MSAYLARLKQLENEKNTDSGPNSEPSKASKAPFDPFEGMHPVRIADAEITTQPPDPVMQDGRHRVLAMLTQHPGTRYAVIVDNADADPVILTLGVRDSATCVLQIPLENFDALLLLDLIGRHGGTMH